MSNQETSASPLNCLALIGMSGRFPGARSVAEFWNNQLRGVEAISHFQVEDLEVANASELARQPNYVRARGVLQDVELFDAEFFGMLPREAELTDPQQRLFLECCWEALEDGGYNPFTYPGSIGVFAGASMSTYFLSRLCPAPGFIEKFTGEYQVGNYLPMIGNSLCFLATRVAYKFNLRGPAFTMQAGCATSLLAVCQACQALLTYQADMALAGAASITLPQKRGYFYQDGGMGSADGHTRTFDASAQGTVFGGGVAAVLVKRLEDAVRDGDQIYAVIRGFAMNNDGSAKVAYTAPSVEGQSNVIAMAQEVSGVDPSTIGYIEAHGTGTPLGDPIELAALTKAFRARTQAKQFCAVGTAKPNVGHLDVAAGVTGLIHASHIVRHGTMPPLLHFKSPNPNFDLANSPFYVNTEAREWKPEGFPRRAGVSAFGVGGSNAHVIIEEPPKLRSTPSLRPAQLLVLSARSAAALEAATTNLQNYLQSNPRPDLADVGYTLQVGRRPFNHRRILVARDAQDAVLALSARDPKRVVTRLVRKEISAVGFLFPGQGSQQPNMGRELYETEPVFREEMDRCAQLLQPDLGLDLRAALYPAGDTTAEVRDKITQTLLAQPAIFTLEYALAKLWMSWGVEPAFMLGHSVGEFTAACLSGVFSLPDALHLIAARGRLMGSLPPGAMLSVRLSEAEIQKYLTRELSLAAINSPSLTVVSGPFNAVAGLEQELTSENIVHRRLHTSHAFHSAMMDPILEPFLAEVRKIALHPPRVPYLSGLTGNWIRAEQATDATYWARHFRENVRFSPAVALLREKDDCALLEVGPGNVLGTLAKQHAAKAADQVVTSSLHDGSAQPSEAASLQQALGYLWLAGIQLDWNKLHAGEKRLRISLPTYPFERKKFWIDVPQNASSPLSREGEPAISNPTPVPVGAAPAALAVFENSMPSKEKSMTSNDSAAPGARRDVVRGILVEIFNDLSGIDVGQADASSDFLDLGFDSLFLTQVTQALQGKFGVKITFRQLLGDQSSLATLSEYLDSKLPPDVLAPVPVVAAAAVAPAVAELAPMPVAVVAPATVALPQAPAGGNGDTTMSESPVARLMREQLEAMNQLFAKQLDVLRSAPSAPVAPVPAVAAAVAPPKPASAVTPAVAPPPRITPAAPPTPAAGTKEEFKPFGPYKPPQKGASAELTEKQNKALQTLLAQFAKHTAKSKSLTQEYRACLADPRVVSGFRAQWKEMVYPIVTVRSKGSRLWDVDGNEHIDFVNGFGPIMLGHRPDFLEKAIEQQLHEGFETGPQTPLAGEVAKMFCDMTGNERMTFCNTGSEAVTAALRVARTVTGRNRVVYFTGDYHGLFDEVLAKGFKNRAGVPQSVPVAPGIPAEKVANVTVLDYGTPESLEWIRQNASDLAAVLVEPVQSRHPHVQPVEFLKEIRRITQESGTALIFDEVVTGFRVHPGGCQALFGIRADLATYGKVLAGGMPIGILAGKAAFMDALDGGKWQFGDDSFPEVGVTFFAGTFVRHPLTLAAAKAVLLHLRQEGPGLQKRLTERTAQLVRTLNEFCEQNSVPTRVETFGSIFYFGFPTEERFASLFYCYLRVKGMHVREGFPCFLTTAHSDSDIERFVQAFKESVWEMQKAGFLPEPAVEATAAAAPGPTAAPLLSETVRESPVTEPQLEVWLSDQLGEEASCSYNESFTVHMRGKVNEVALKEAIQQLIARHDALRASFSNEGDVQRFAPQLKIEIPTVDLTALGPTERETRLRKLIEDDAHTPFHLNQGPLIRAQLVKMEPQYELLIVTSHHIVCDGWSTNVLLDELSKIYNALNRGAAWEIPAPMSFASYAKLQKEFLDSPEGAKVEKYWLEQFQQAPPLLDLPTDRPRPAVKEFKGATYRHKIGAASYTNIKKQGAKNKCTLFVTLLSGFQILLSRLSGQEDVVVGIPTAGQSLLEDAVLVGHCVNFIPLRGRPAGNSTAAEYLTRMKQLVLTAYEHQNYTYGRLVRKLKLERDPGRLPLTEIQFNLERVGEGIQFDGFAAEIDPNPKSFVNFDIFLNIVESKDGLLMDCDYNTGLFDESTIARWLNHYETLLEGMVADVNRPIAALPLLNDADRGLMLTEWNATTAEYPRDVCVHQLFEARVRENPAKVAAVFGDEALTYTELDQRANQLARHLQKLGARPGVLVGVLVERSMDMMISLLAVLKTGGAYVPMDPTYPAERIAFVLSNASVALLVTGQRLAAGLPAGGTRIVDLDTICEHINHEPCDPLSVEVAPEDLAYVIYTSGSTGKPKGVEIQHRAVVNFLTSMRRKPGLEARDTLLAVTTLSFDIAGLELFLPLVVGAKLVIASREAAADGNQLLARLRSCGATVMQATPVTWKLLLEAGWNGDPRLKVFCGGEAVPRNLANQLLERADSLWNMYGPTETTIWSATGKISSGDGPVLIGPPINNTQFYVLDANGQLAPMGVPGELHIGGDGLARGYFRSPELTAEKFIPNPFSADPQARLYKTGDLVRRVLGGEIEFLGRLDNQVKLRGFRIELGEIETVLARLPGVREAVVVLREDVAGDKRLVAYVTTDQQALTVTAVRELLTGKLPNYMLPSAVVRMDAMPLTPNGKIDRKALPAPESGRNNREREFVAPRTDHEKTLAQIWAEVLHLERVGVQDNLFELGADSLHIFQIAARAAKAGITIAPAQFLRHRTITALLAQLDGEKSADGIGKIAMAPILAVSREKYRVRQSTS